MGQNVAAKPHLTPLEKAKAKLDVSRHRVEMYEDELKTTIPKSEHWHTTRRGTLSSVLCYNYRMCHFKVVSQAVGANASEGGAAIDGIIEMVNVIVEQAEEMLAHLEGMCMRGPLAERLIIKDYTIALQGALRGLLQLDGSKMGWQTVRKEVREIADIAYKADQAIIFLSHQHNYNEDRDIYHEPAKIVLPETLRLKKKAEKKTARRQRSRIDDYMWASVPEVQREAMKQKKLLETLSHKEREESVLTNMTQYKMMSSRTGTHRMNKGDEVRVHRAVAGISAHYAKDAW